MAAWYALASRPQREIAAVDALAAYGFAAFTPQHFRIARPRKGSKRKPAPIPVPMFRGYLFAQFEAVPWAVIRAEKRTIRAVLSVDYRPVEIPGDLIAAVQALSLASAAYLASVDTHKALAPLPGQPVEVIDGPLVGLKGTVTRSTINRVRILMNMIGAREVDVPIEHVAVAA